MNQETVRKIAADLDRALEQISNKHGVKLVRGTLRYDSMGFSGSLTCKALTEKGLTEIARSMCARLGYDPEKHNPMGYKIVDYNTRAHKTPWIVERGRQALPDR